MSHLNINNYLYISVGEFSVYYTLRNIRKETFHDARDEYGRVFSYSKENDYYLFNLSTDKNEAIKKAKIYASENNLQLKKVNDSLIVLGKIGDAKQKRESKYGVSGGFIEKKKPDEPIVWTIPKRSEEEKALEKQKQLEYDLKIANEKKARVKYFSDPDWKIIRRYLFENFVYTNSDQWNGYLRRYSKYSFEWRKEARFIFSVNSGFIKDMLFNLDKKFYFSPRQLEIVLSIYCKQFGRKGSKAYQKEFDRLITKFGE